MIGIFFEKNLKKIKFLFVIFLFVCLIIQLFLIEDSNNIPGLLYLLISNLLIFFYCLNANNIRNFTISTFSILYICFHTNCSAIFLKSIFWEPVDENLFNSNFTLFFLLISNLIIILIHILYKKITFFQKLVKYFQKIFFYFNIDQAYEKNFLFFIGLVSLVSAFIFYVFFNELIYDNSFTEPKLIGDLLNGTNIFFICPMIVLFTSKIYNYHLTKKDFFIILISIIFIFFISLGLNNRSAFFDILFTGILIYVLLILTGIIEIKVLRFNKIFIILLFGILVANTIDRFSYTYIDVRDIRDKTNPVLNIKNHFNIFLANETKNKNKDQSNRIFKEDYYKISILNRINIVKNTDNVLYANLFLNSVQKNDLLDYELGQIISIAPQPIINIFSSTFNKSVFLQKSITSKIYKSVDKYFVGGKSSGSLFPILYVYNNYLYLSVFIFFVLISFSVLDSLKYDNRYLIILFIFLYSTSGGLINFISTGSTAKLVSILVRTLPQSIIIFALLNFIYKKFKNKT